MTRGRPRAFDADRALEQATALFRRRGYRATTTRDLESAIGVAPSSLYHAFGSKSELFGPALSRYQEQLDRELLGPLRDGPAGLDAVDAFLSALARRLLADDTRGSLIGRMMSESGAPEPVVVLRLEAYREDLRAALGAALSRAAAAGEVRPGDAEARVSLLVGAVLGLNLAVQPGFGPPEIEGIVTGTRAEVAGWRLGPEAP